jgi:hypothetical protein
MLRQPEFDSKEIDPDLHKRMEKAVLDGRIKCFNMLEGSADGDQDLNFWTRQLEDVVREIMEDPIFKGNQKYSFEMDLDEAGNRLFGGQASAGVAFQIGQLRYIRTYAVFVSIFGYIHCTCIDMLSISEYVPDLALVSICRVGEGTVPLAIVVYPSNPFTWLSAISTQQCQAKLVHGGCWA